MPDNVALGEFIRTRGGGRMTFEEVPIETRTQWRRWLAENHASSPGVWLVRWKKDSGHPHLAYDDVVEEALCFGWIDSQPRSKDETRSLLRVTPRSPRSNWSAINKARVERLTAVGLMQPAGLAVVEAAKRSGRWGELDPVEQLIVPDDLAAPLEADAQAQREWDGFPRSTKRAILEWLNTARTPETRATRIERIIADARIGIRTNQWRQPKRPPSPD